MWANVIMCLGAVCFVAVFCAMLAACRIFFTLKRNGTRLVIEERPKVQPSIANKVNGVICHKPEYKLPAAEWKTGEFLYTPPAVQTRHDINETNELLARAFGPANVSRKLEMPLDIDVDYELDEFLDEEEPTIQLATSEVRAILQHTERASNG